MSIVHHVMLASLFTVANVVAAAGTEQDFNITLVAEGNYLHKGTHVAIDDAEHDDIANIGFIIGEKCVAVIDTGGSVSTGQKLLASIKTVTHKPICYVINTHVHFDHILGNKAFVQEGPAFVGHQQLAVEVERNRPFFLAQFKNDLGPDPDTSSIISPDLLIDKPRQLDLGNRMLTLMPFPVSHSHSDLIIIDNKTRTLWAGDLIFRERIPTLAGSLIGWLKAMTDIQQLPVNTVIPGHGSVANSMAAAIVQQQDYLQRLLEQTRAAIATGQFVNEAVETIDNNNQSNWLLHADQHPANVSKAFAELEWE